MGGQEGHNFDIRKQLLEYDDVMNKQREVVYQHRRAVLGGEDLHADIVAMIEEIVESQVNMFCPEDQYPEEWDVRGLAEALHAPFGVTPVLEGDKGPDQWRDIGQAALRDDLRQAMLETYRKKEAELTPELLRYLEKMVLLQIIDHHWKDHLLGMDQLRDGIGLRGYGQKDPLIEYKREGYDMFSGMMDRIKVDTVDRMFHVQAVRQEAAQPTLRAPQRGRLSLNRGEDAAPARPAQRQVDKVGHNEPCPCGSGKKYKKCHGQ